MLKRIRNNRLFKWLSNRYVIVLLAFAVWMLFFDANSFLVHRELNKEIKELEKNQSYFNEEISTDNKFLENLKDTAHIEKYAREKYYFKKENEDIFIIEFEDSIQP
jgi:cell division protein DivIC